ncbi:MAG: sulfatase [Planctomycetaceae bacterium]|nr:sulfatase [Planctomycetaceae bacterium]
MMLRAVILAAGLWCWLASCNPSLLRATGVPDESTPRPNVVVFLVDDLGVMDSSVPFLTDANGKPQRYPLNDFYRTPNLEALAAQGVRFNQFEAMSVCSPTRISLLTGQYAARHRTTNWINPTTNNRAARGPKEWNWQGLQANSITLPQLLRDAGYRTIHVGKGHLGPVGSEGEDPVRVGYDVNIGGSAIGQPGSYFGLKQFGAGGTHPVPHLEAYHGQDVFLTDALTREAIARIDEALAAGKPFFLNFSHYAVHAPFQADSRFANEYQSSGRSPQAQAFASLVAGVDHSLGTLMKHLRQRGVAQDTLFIFMGDNGSDAPLGEPHAVACAAPLRGKKGSHYEGGTRAPLIMAWAERDETHVLQQQFPIRSNAIQTQLTSVCDLFPTVLDVTKIASPDGHHLDGSSLRELLAGDALRAASFLMHYPHEHRSSYFTSFRNDRWKVIYHYVPNIQSGGATYELFDLQADPFESTNVAAAEPEMLRTMMQQLVAGLEACHAVYPEDENGQPLHPVVP